MFPPRIAGWSGSAARIAWASDDVVVLPFSPGHADRRRRAESQEQVGLGHEGRRGRVARSACGHQGLQCGPQVWLGCRVVRRDRG